MGLDDRNGSVFSAGDSVPLGDAAVLLHREDDVAIAKFDLPDGLTLEVSDAGAKSRQVTLRASIPSGHKLALQALDAGDPVHRYGQVIGQATRRIQSGEHVHTHNLGIADDERGLRSDAAPAPVIPVPQDERRTFRGYERADGRVGTRNYVAVISTVNCSAFTCRQIARHFTPERLAAYSNVDGVIALTHPYGCGMHAGGANYRLLQRTLAGMARHPNVGAAILVGLGCEGNQVDDLIVNCGLCTGDVPGCPPGLVIQELGGIAKTVAAGIRAVEDLLPRVNAVQRSTQPVSALTLALQCGGSDSWSGVTANPIVGLVADQVVRQGGSAVLSETPEIYGAEHLLTRRAINREVAEKLESLLRWWEAYTKRLGTEMDDDRSPGNEAGGLTTIYEKSLGSTAKAGSTPLVDVCAYAERVTAAGLSFMDAPGTDCTAVTGQVAGGCNLVLFTTGRGSVFGFKPAPSIKISTNSATFGRMIDDMDLNAGRALEGETLETVAADLFEMVIAVASGRPSKSEAQGVGEDEFNPWNLGGTL